jgi:glycogen debranching enzyme
MTIKFDRTICCELNETISREWLVTNGQGGYATGTVAGVLTRMQQGILVATLPDTYTPQLLLAKMDEEVTFDQRTYYLGTNEYQDGTFNPSGFVHLESFCLQDGFPVFTYRLGGVDGLLLEKRIWMAQGFNTTYIQYRVLRPSLSEKPGNKPDNANPAPISNQGLLTPITSAQEKQELTLTLLPLASYRPYNMLQRYHPEQRFYVRVHGTEDTAKNAYKADADSMPEFPQGTSGASICPAAAKMPFHILAVGDAESKTIFIPTGVWYWNFLRRHDAAAGREHLDDLYLPGVIRAQLNSDTHATLNIVISAERLQPQLYQPESIEQLYQETKERQRDLTERTRHAQRLQWSYPHPTIPVAEAESAEYLQHLLYASEHFLVRPVQNPSQWREVRPQTHIDIPNHNLEHKSQEALVLLSDYYSMENKTRDALIALPGLLLVTEKYRDAQLYLSKLADYFVGGILPDRLPTGNNALTDHDYSSVDITLWYFYALNCYLKATHHYAFLEELFPKLAESINHYIHGTHNGISCDPIDGLLTAQKEGKALTWMNMYGSGRPITPRAGKAVEVNALWYHALSLMQGWSERLGYRGHSDIGYSVNYYQQYANHCKHNFQRRFWNAARGCLYDVIDGPEGNDASLRVNQLFALSLPHTLLEPTYRQRVFETITEQLVTAYGLRTLAPQESAYHSHIKVDSRHPDDYQQALHQGSSWTWLIGPYIDAILAQPQTSIIEQNREHLWRQGMQQLEPSGKRFYVDLLNMCEGIFDGDSPQHVGPQSSSLLTTAELLRSYDQLLRMHIEQPDSLLSH